jgi:hypothetical protein
VYVAFLSGCAARHLPGGWSCELVEFRRHQDKGGAVAGQNNGVASAEVIIRDAAEGVDSEYEWSRAYRDVFYVCRFRSRRRLTGFDPRCNRHSD